MKRRTSWCAALAAYLALAATSTAEAAKKREYQMAGNGAGMAEAALDGDVQQASYNGSYTRRGVNGFGVATPLADRQYQFFGYGEYIYARASFSEALAYIISDPNDPQGGQTIVEYDFDYESSYRFGGGINFCDCGGAIVFNFARYKSSGDFNVTDTSTVPGTTIFGPYEIDAPGAGGSLLGNADANIDSYDVGFAKTFCLGGPCCPCTSCCDCGSCCDTCCDTCDTCCDPCCGGGSGCGPCCPNWELTWTAAARFDDVDWGRSTAAFQANGAAVDREDTRLTFSGAGLRTGLLGRRYIGRNGWFSIFAKGDISLLVGDMDIRTDTTNAPGTPQQLTLRSYSNSGRRVIPVTEIEAGLAMNLTNNICLSSGYFIAAWHDLGMRDEYDFSGIPGLQLSHFDDANILGFDGFFARAEVAF